MAIDSLGALREHLQTAIEIEHSTLPPYLTALYSIRPGSNAEATSTLLSVVLEEMLHLTLAANLLNAVGVDRAATGRGPRRDLTRTAADSGSVIANDGTAL